MNEEPMDMDIDELFGTNSDDSNVVPVDEKADADNNIVMLDDIKIILH